jgi:hypothetical protein
MQFGEPFDELHGKQLNALCPLHKLALSEVKEAEERLQRYKSKINPLTLGAIFADVQKVAEKRWKGAASLHAQMDKTVKRIVSEGGILGSERLTYYNFGRRLFALIKNKPPQTWNDFIEGELLTYTKGYKLRRELLEKIKDAIVALTREWQEKRESEEGGSTQP